jgi:hypothetical protein
MAANVSWNGQQRESLPGGVTSFDHTSHADLGSIAADMSRHSQPPASFVAGGTTYANHTSHHPHSYVSANALPQDRPVPPFAAAFSQGYVSEVPFSYRSGTEVTNSGDGSGFNTQPPTMWNSANSFTELDLDAGDLDELVRTVMGDL